MTMMSSNMRLLFVLSVAKRKRPLPPTFCKFRFKQLLGAYIFNNHSFYLLNPLISHIKSNKMYTYFVHRISSFFCKKSLIM